VEHTYSYAPDAPNTRESGVRRHSAALDAAQASPPTAALSAFIAALEVTDEAALIIDRAGIIVCANTACETLFGCGALIGRCALRLHALDARGLRSILSELNRHNVWRGQLPVHSVAAPPAANNTDTEASAARAKRFEQLSVVVRRVALTPGRARHFCLVARAHAAREPLGMHGEHGDIDTSVLSAVGRLAGEIAHDFNNHIAVVINYSFILLRQLPDDSPLRAHVTEMQTAAWRASEVAQEMMGFGGQRNADSDDIDLNAVLGDVQALFTYALRENTRLELRLADDLWRVRARRAHIEWLLVELASRMRMTLGPIERFDITTYNAARCPDASLLVERRERARVERVRQLEQNDSVVVCIEGRARKPAEDTAVHAADAQRAVFATLSAPPELSADRRPFGSSTMSGLRGAELALAHTQGELTVQQLPDGALRYRIRLPAV
jgi:signal transduction histidine kinase